MLFHAFIPIVPMSWGVSLSFVSSITKVEPEPFVSVFWIQVSASVGEFHVYSVYL